jgi:hypothetical protein
MSRGDFRKLYADLLPYLKEIIGPDSWPEVDQQWERYFNVISSDRMREEWLLTAGFGNFMEMNENENVVYDSMLQGPSKSVTHTLYGKGFQIGLLAARHDLHGIASKNAAALGRSQRVSIQELAAAFYNGAFTTTTTADGLSLCNAAHTYIRGGGTWSNYSTATLGQTALETALVAFRKQKDLQGNPQPLRPVTLLVPPDLEPVAFELSESRLRSDTTTHAESFLYNKLTTESWPNLTITTAWFILGPKSESKNYWIWNIRPETSHGFNFDNEAAKTKALFACSTAAVDPRGTYGSRGY